MTFDPVSWLWGLPIAIVVAVALFRISKIEPGCSSEYTDFNQTSTYLATTGLAFLLLGLVPYLMAGYTSSIGFTSQSRIYSSASYGLAMLLGLLVSAGSKPKVRFALRSLGILSICLMAVFLASLRNEWQEARRQRTLLCNSLLDQAPDVAPGTTFLFLNLQSYISRDGVDRAVVFQGVEGLSEWIRMLYGKRSVNAHFLYSREDVASDDREYRRAIVSDSGVIARGSLAAAPIPLNHLLIFKRDSDQLQLLEGLSREDGIAAIEWTGISRIDSNVKLILNNTGPVRHKGQICGE
jgi:hypothetical protein